MSGANLVSVQKLLGHSNPKITAETYAHLAPDYLLAEVNLLRFGVDQLAPVAMELPCRSSNCTAPRPTSGLRCE